MTLAADLAEGASTDAAVDVRLALGRKADFEKLPDTQTGDFYGDEPWRRNIRCAVRPSSDARARARHNGVVGRVAQLQHEFAG